MLGRSIAVMTSKGGVGKSTLSLAIAETLATYYHARVLLIDADPQGTLTSLFEATRPPSHVSITSLLAHQHELADALEPGGTGPSPNFFASDIDDAEHFVFCPVGEELVQFERCVIRDNLDKHLSNRVQELLSIARAYFHYIIIDCSPSFFLTTELWLRHADFQITPVKMERPSFMALQKLLDYRTEMSINTMSHWLGCIANYETGSAPEQSTWDLFISANHNFFSSRIPQALALSRITIGEPLTRSYLSKYPGLAGIRLRNLTAEIIGRIEDTFSSTVDARNAR